MTRLVYGKRNQVKFATPRDKIDAFRYILGSDNVSLVHEDNDEQGAWAAEERVHFKSNVGVPQCLLDNMTAGRGGLFGRINCGDLVDAIRHLQNKGTPITDADILSV